METEKWTAIMTIKQQVTSAIGETAMPRPATSRLRRWRLRLLAIIAAACVVAAPASAAETTMQKHPDVLAAKVRPSGPDMFDFDVTVSSPYDSRSGDGGIIKMSNFTNFNPSVPFPSGIRA